jgi:hypothetical protein
MSGEFFSIGIANDQIQESENISNSIKKECKQIDSSISHCAVLLQQLLDYFDMGSPRIEPIDGLELVS